jgi:hypothetical protein
LYTNFKLEILAVGTTAYEIIREDLVMSALFLSRSRRAIVLSLSMIPGVVSIGLAQEKPQGKVVGAYFEEWGIHYAGSLLSKTGLNLVDGR